MIGSEQWYKERTEMFSAMPHAVWLMARIASCDWITTKGNITKWDASINKCQAKHPQFTLDQIKQAFECERDDVLGSICTSN